MSFVEEPARRVPVIADVDVLVAGGGPAGIAAAIAAGREGAQTLLVERYGYLGGMITGAHVVAVLGCGDGRGPKVRGLTQEIRERFDRLGAITPIREDDYRVDAEVFKWQAVEMLREAGTNVLLHTMACAPILENGQVAGAIFESKSGRQAVRARVTVDATADANLAFRAGCPCDDQTHDVTLGLVVEGLDAEKIKTFKDQSPQEYAKAVQRATELNGGVPFGRSRKMPGVDVADAAALTRAEIEFRRGFFAALEHLRNNVPGYEKARIKETRPQIGVRQGRRVRGEYALTDDDLCASRHFDDGIGRLGVYFAVYGSPYQIKGLDYDVPYRCLVPAAMDGLLIAGRSVSCDYKTCNTMRLIAPCFVTGQAAGAAAALAAKNGSAPRRVPIADLRAALREQNVNLG